MESKNVECLRKFVACIVVSRELFRFVSFRIPLFNVLKA